MIINIIVYIFNLQYEKLILGGNGEVIKSEFVVEGQKQPLTEIG